MSVYNTLAPVVLEPASQRFVEATANPPFLYELTPAEARKVLDDVQAAPIDKLPVDERWMTPAPTSSSPRATSSPRSRWRGSGTLRADVERRSEPYASPLRASDEQLAGLPPALVIVDEADVLRDEGEAYAARLRAAGVAVTTVRYDGITHDFMMLNPLSGTHATRAAVAQAIAPCVKPCTPPDPSPSKEPKHELAHRPHPRPLAHPAQLGGLEGAVRAARTRGPRAGVAPHGGRGRGPPPRPVRPERARPRRGRRPLRADHPRPRHPAGDHGALHRRPADRAAARPRPRCGRGRPVARAGEGRAARAAGRCFAPSSRRSATRRTGRRPSR